jgi:hypothetical protein
MVRPVALLVSTLFAVSCGDDLRGPASPDGGGGDGDGGPPDAGAPPGIERAHAGGAPAAVAIAGDLVYVAVGPRVAIWGPEGLVGETEPYPGMVSGLAVDGDRAFVAEHTDLRGRVHVVDVSDPAAPVETAQLVLADEGFTLPRGMAVRGRRLYVADQEQGIAVVDISDPDMPDLRRIIPHGGVADLHVVGDRLYYTASGFIGGAVGALDLTDNLADLGEIALFGANGVAVAPGDLVVAAGEGGIQVQDVSDLGNPIELYRFTLDVGGPFSRAVSASASAAWVPAEDGFYVVDLADPGDISHSGPFDLDTRGSNATAWSAAELAVVSDRGFLTRFEVSGAEPVESSRAEISICSDCVGVALRGDLLLVADFLAGLRTTRVTDLTGIGRSAPLEETVVYEDVAVAGDTAYAADWLYGLRIHDISDPADPVLVGGVDTAGYPSSVWLAGELAYLGESTNGGALRVIDVAVPAEIGATATSQARDVEVQGGLAFVADGSLDLVGGLRVFDVSDPQDIELVSHYSQDCSEALDVSLTGSLAIVACSFDGFHVIDVSDPARPVRRAVVPAGDIASAWSVTAWEGGAALGHDFGVIVVDLADPTAPEITAEHLTAWTVRALTASADGRLVAGCGPGGIYQWLME